MAKPAPRACAHCGEEFRPRLDRQRFCTRTCQVAAANAARQVGGELGAFLMDVARRDALTVQALAERLGVDRSTLDDWLAGRVVPGPAGRRKLRESLGEAVPIPEKQGRPSRAQPGVSVTCPVCGKSFIERWPSEKRIYCSDACARDRYSRKWEPGDTPLARFLYRRWIESGVGPDSWAASIKMDCRTLHGLIEGRLPKKKTLEALKAAFGSSLPVSPTKTKAEKEAAFKAGHPSFVSAEAQARAAASRRGKRQYPEVVKRRYASAVASGGFERFQAAGARMWGDVKRRCVAGLRRRLKAVGNPSKETIQEWARLTAGQIGCPVGLVRDIFLLEMQPAAKSKRGRRSDWQWHDAAARTLLSVSVGLYDRWPWGMSEQVAKAVCRARGYDGATDWATVEKMWQNHRRRGPCPRCVAMTLASTPSRRPKTQEG